MNISSNSWHFKLAEIWGRPWRAKTTCDYIRSLLWSSLVGLFFLSIFGVIIGAFIAACISNPAVLLVIPIVAAAFAIVIGLVWLKDDGIYIIGNKLDKWFHPNGKLPEPEKEPGTLTKLYRAFKSKTCVFVTITE